MSAAPSESSPLRAKVQKEPTGEVSVKLSLSVGRTSAVYFLFAMATLGTFLLFTQANVAKATTYDGKAMDIHPFTNLFIGVVLMTAAQVSEVLVPGFARKLFKTFGTMLFINNIDQCICLMNGFHYMGSDANGVANYPKEINQRNTLRVGGGFVVMPCLILFLMTYFRQKPDFSAIMRGGMPAIRMFVRIIAILLILLGQIVVWSIKKNCRGGFLSATEDIRQLSVFSTVVVMLSGNFFDDGEAFDLAFVLAWNIPFQQTPYFDDTKSPYDQSNFNSLWQTEVAMIFTGTILYIASVLFSRRDTSTPIMQRVKTLKFAVYAVCFVVGIAAAICIFVRSPDISKDDDKVTYQTKARVYLGCWAIFVPLFSMLGHITGLRSFQTSAELILLASSFRIAFVFNEATTVGYLRGGFLMEILVIFTCALIGQLISAPSLKPINEYFEGGAKSYVSVSAIVAYFAALSFETNRNDYLFWCGVSLLILFGRLNDNADTYRVLYFMIITVITAPGAGLWPILPQIALFPPNVLLCVLFISSTWFIWNYSIESNENAFDCISPDNFAYDAMDASAEGSYQSLDSNHGDKAAPLIDEQNKEGAADTQIANPQSFMTVVSRDDEA